LEGRQKIHVVEEDGPDPAMDFANRVVEILEKPKKAKSMARGAKAFIRRNYSWIKSGKRLEQLLKEAKRTAAADQRRHALTVI
jgi:glycosyltransferase involved in cell wall biosynthesis